jgi:hypothetical protein
MNFEILPILTDYANKKKGGMKLFGWDWLNSFREDFFKISSPLFLNLQ